MLKKIRIGSKITALVLTLVLIAILIVSFISYDLNRKSVEKRYFESVQVIANLKAQKVETFFNQIASAIYITQELPVVKNMYQTLGQKPSGSSTESLDATLAPIRQMYGLANIYLTDTDGKVLYIHDNSATRQTVGETLQDTHKTSIEKGLAGLHYGNIFQQGKNYYQWIAAPITTTEGSQQGVIVFEVNMMPVYSLANDTIGLGNTGEIILAKISGSKVIYINPLRLNPESALKEVSYKDEYALHQAVKGKSNIGFDTDYRGKAVLAAWHHIQGINWGMVVKVDSEEVYASVNQLRNYFIIAGLVVLAGALAVGFIFSRFLINPLLSLKQTMSLLGEGILPEKLEKNSNDEIGEMADTVNNLVEGLKKTASFAHKIGEGDFAAEFKPMSNNDILGLSLINMRDSIQESAKRDEEQNWIVTGVAEIGDILRSTNNLAELSERVVAYLTKKVDAIQGAFYVVNDEEEENRFIEMTASYAYHKKKYLSAKFKFAEGLVGQAAIEQDTILRTEVPDNYVTITSGLLGDRKPKCILIVPLITVIGSDKEVFGVLELAGFEKFSSRNVRFVNEISEILARTIFNIKVNETTRVLLEKSQKQSEELQEQQEILRQNAEEMQSTQEELKRTNHALEDQIEQVNRAQKKMQVLLENASEVITIYEQDRRVRYVSPSVEKILGYKQEELIGLNDIIYVNEQGVESVDRMFQELMENPEQKLTIQFSYSRKNGERIWLEATGTNLLSDPAIEGIVLNSRDITERRRAEQEARMRGQMQALSENSPDLITRFNKEGKVFYINPIIESYTGYSKDEFISKSLEEVSLNESVVTAWSAILKEVMTNKEKLSTEMDFPSLIGDRVMQINAIPEYNEQNLIESVLLVSHDITDRKQIELEVQSKNKKITESINYAKRIQGAILPNNEIIKEIFPESFILYKPRDVVSGDFPWFLQRGDDMYIAAVDCTGHGVPGALISLIGYFLLNNIVNNKDVAEPGEVLDMLDKGVTQTLRQDSEDSSTRDGMDIALCKINLKTNTLQYAGAHRPLYFLHGGELTEVKGDKFPIGGGQYKSRTSFTTTTLTISEGDAVYFCSDGFPDQFGGPDNRKFSPKRIREIILEHSHNNIETVHKVFDQEFEAWKGEEKQTDDVLMIGIKF
ncbi:PAS domain S-box protein [Rhodocytophaga aerolata]|uniref:PAS domain S-box protein n=1 Tax=Rhodocytophaga aerolata TaxID=455078 RepID=A0ABT8R1V2_9BACT|nr:PAS domain S-box protein [Rhodocytophaga aerolata]MDO1446073.1 PAS domain S-box protein [Rhodocytophaga aerolata]